MHECVKLSLIRTRKAPLIGSEHGDQMKNKEAIETDHHADTVRTQVA